MLKIISGQYKSRVLKTPPDSQITRPYTQRVRESVFNLLRGWFEDASVLDLFAGVGSMGLEAVSRGARTVLLVERNQKIADMLQANIDELGCSDRARILPGDALAQTCLLRAERPVDVIFVDPPYEMMKGEESRTRVLEQVSRCREIMGDEGFVVLRSPLGPNRIDLTIPGFHGPEEHTYGKEMSVLLYAPAPTGG